MKTYKIRDLWTRCLNKCQCLLLSLQYQTAPFSNTHYLHNSVSDPLTFAFTEPGTHSSPKKGLELIKQLLGQILQTLVSGRTSGSEEQQNLPVPRANVRSLATLESIPSEILKRGCQSVQALLDKGPDSVRSFLYRYAMVSTGLLFWSPQYLKP